jgi:hypothetical protein
VFSCGEICVVAARMGLAAATTLAADGIVFSGRRYAGSDGDTRPFVLLAAAVATAGDVAGVVVKLARQDIAVVTLRARGCSPVLGLRSEP